MWSRNLANLFVSPLRPVEHVLSLILMSLIRTLIGVVPASLLAIPLYHYSIYGLGLPLVGFFANLLVMSWAMGLPITALILRFGQGAESLAWFLIFLLAPVSAVYYPVPPCRAGCSLSPGRCPRLMSSRGCGHSWWRSSSAAIFCSRPPG